MKKTILFPTLCIFLCFSFYVGAADNEKPTKRQIKKQVTSDRQIVYAFWSMITDEYIYPVNSSKLLEACKLKVGLTPEEYTDKKEELSKAEVVKGIEELFPFQTEVDDLSVLRQRRDDCLAGFVSILDERSQYIDEEELKSLTEHKGAATGIELKSVENGLKVVSVYENSPAEAAGIKKDDVIRAIDGLETLGIKLAKAINMLRGKPGTKVELLVEKQGEVNLIPIVVERGHFKIISVKSNLFQDGVGYVQLKNFNKDAAKSLANAIKELELQNKKPLTGIILDLRENGGGLFSESVGVAAAFLPKDRLVTYTGGRKEESNLRLTTDRDFYIRTSEEDFIDSLPSSIKTIPVVVLINNSTGGSAEVVAGALQDHERATIMGVQSSGHGTLQTILPTNIGTALKISTAKIFTPLGHSFDVSGISPDLRLSEGDWIKIAKEYIVQKSETGLSP